MKIFIAVSLVVVGYLAYLFLFPGMTYKGVSVTDNTGIGNDWKFDVTINGQRVTRGMTVAPVDGYYNVYVKATEVDKYSDVGSVKKTFYTKYKGSQQMTVVVHENRGKGAGGSAVVVFKFRIK